MLLSQYSLGEIFSDSRTQGQVLLGGLAVLTLTLLVLMRTRWGQVKPLSKCIALSIFAHVLLGGYAYGTRLILPGPEKNGSAADNVVELTFVDMEDEDSSQIEDEEKPWDAFMGDPLGSPELITQQPANVELTSGPVKRDALEIEDPNHSSAMADFAAQLPQDVVKDPTIPQLIENAITVPVATVKSPQIAPQIAQPAEMQTQPIAQTDRPQAEEIPDILANSEKLQRLEAGLPDATGIERKDVQVARPIADFNAAVQDLSRQLIESDLQTRPNRLKAQFASRDTRNQRNDVAIQRLGVRRLSDGQMIPKLYALRVSDDRRAIAIQNGGTAGTEDVVQAALRWLAANQSEDGRWDASELEAGREDKVAGQDRGKAGADADTGISGLALLAFLAAGHSHLEGDYQETVQHGLEFLLRSQQASGSLSGEARLFAQMYCHSMATLAISEAYALTGDQRLKPFVEKALQYTIQAQHPTTGGWRYRPGDDGDMSQFGWQVMALKSGELAGVETPAKTREGMLRFLQSVSAGDSGGLARYRSGEKVSRTMTAESLCCRIFLGLSINAQMEQEVTEYLLAELPQPGKANYYYWYYGTMAMYQLGGDSWERWNSALQKELISRQRKDGALAGSFDTDSVWGGYGGRAYTTAMSALCLEVYYRYLPVLESK